jgi:hypothetical protein
VGSAPVGAAAPAAVVLLGDVGEIEEMREGAGHRQDQRDGHRGELAGQLLELRLIAAARAFRERAHAFDDLQQLASFECGERVAEQIAKQMDVLPKSFVRIVAHLPTIAHAASRAVLESGKVWPAHYPQRLLQ